MKGVVVSVVDLVVPMGYCGDGCNTSGSGDWKSSSFTGIWKRKLPRRYYSPTAGEAAINHRRPVLSVHLSASQVLQSPRSCFMPVTISKLHHRWNDRFFWLPSPSRAKFVSAVQSYSLGFLHSKVSHAVTVHLEVKKKRIEKQKMASSSSSNPPCAACKFLRRKCVKDCIFAPYFPPEEPQKFANVHKIFGASNVSKLLNEIAPHQRDDAVSSLAYEAEARLKDPVYGCVGAISVLQGQVLRLQKELEATNADLLRYTAASNSGPSMVSSSSARTVHQLEKRSDHHQGERSGFDEDFGNFPDSWNDYRSGDHHGFD
ncbi:hypothetical protein Ancab_002752 [Ancistrocladus abbreviatus]